MFTTGGREREEGIATELPALVAPLTRRGLRGRRALKRFLYAQMALRQALLIALGREQPLLPFTVEADPPSVYWVFRLRPEVVDGLGARLGLPDHLELVPVRCLPDDEPAHLLTLNVYRVSGLATGLRAEWSVYVSDQGGPPRYLVVDARSSTTSMDPVDVITRRSPVTHERVGDELRTAVGAGTDAFRCTLSLPRDDEPALVRVAPAWVTANDSIYWGNGISDRTWYDASMADARQVALAPDAMTITDGSPWATLVEPEPAHVLVLLDAIELVISPWENLERLDP